MGHGLHVTNRTPIAVFTAAWIRPDPVGSITVDGHSEGAGFRVTRGRPSSQWWRTWRGRGIRPGSALFLWRPHPAWSAAGSAPDHADSAASVVRTSRARSIVAGDQCGVLDFGNLVDLLPDRLPRLLGDAQVDVRRDAVAQSCRLDNRGVTRDHPELLQPVHPGVDTGPGEGGSARRGPASTAVHLRGGRR